jgi:hypothetical protein
MTFYYTAFKKKIEKGKKLLCAINLPVVIFNYLMEVGSDTF